MSLCEGVFAFDSSCFLRMGTHLIFFEIVGHMALSTCYVDIGSEDGYGNKWFKAF